jgi:hypothetical protein
MALIISANGMLAAADAVFKEAIQNVYGGGITDPGHCHGIVENVVYDSSPPLPSIVRAIVDSKHLDVDPATKIVKQPCGKAPPKGIDFVPAVGAPYQTWRTY